MEGKTDIQIINNIPNDNGRFPANLLVSGDALNNGDVERDAGSYSRFFDLDAWFRSKLPEQAQKTYPALIVPKPSKSEKNKYAENIHPTVKQLKLMSYLITMGSREGDLVLDPFAGSGTTLEAANMLKRRFIGCELDEKYKDLIESRAFMRTKTKNT
jgi:DNA modification methylase